MSFHAGFTGRAREAVLVAAPDISQWALNRLSLALYVAEDSETELQHPAFHLINAIRVRAEQCVQSLGTDNPYDVCKALLGLSSKERAAAAPHLSSLRLFPLPRLRRQGRNQFPQIIHAYVNQTGGAFAHMPVESWAEHAQKMEMAHAAEPR